MEIDSELLVISYINVRPLRTDADVKTRFHRDRPNSEAVSYADRGRRLSRQSLAALRLEKDSGQSPLHDVKDARIADDIRLRKFGSRQEQSKLVEPDGIEPTTSCLQSRRSPS